MSTFSRPVRDLFIVNAVATETTTKTFIDSASAQEATVLKKDGTGASAANNDCYVVAKDSNGRFRASDVLSVGKVKTVTKVDPTTVVPANSSFVIDKTGVETSDIWEGLVRISGYGSLSPYDEYLTPFSHVQLAGDNNDSISEAIIKSLSFNFSRVEGGNSTFVHNITGYVAVYTTEAAAVADIGSLVDTNLVWVMENNKAYTYDSVGSDFGTYFTEKTDWSTEIAAETAIELRGNPWFEFVKLDGATPTIYIIAKNQTTVDMKIEGYDITFKTGLQILDGTAFDVNSTFAVTNVGKVGSAGEGKNIRRLETFTKGHTGDFYRGMGYPNNFEATYDADVNTNYYLVNVEFEQANGDVNTLSGHPSQKVLQLACDDDTTATTLYNALNALK